MDDACCALAASLAGDQIEHKNNLSSMRDCFLVVCWQKTTKSECNKQPLVWGKVALHIEHKKAISHQWDIAFWLFVVKNNKKWTQQATSGVGQGCFAFELNANKSIMDERFLFGCLCWPLLPRWQQQSCCFNQSTHCCPPPSLPQTTASNNKKWRNEEMNNASKKKHQKPTFLCWEK